MLSLERSLYLSSVSSVVESPWLIFYVFLKQFLFSVSLVVKSVRRGLSHCFLDGGFTGREKFL